jgi:hypothetical protein
MSLYEQARALLQAQYQKNREIVKNSPFHLAYVEEKLRHSLQVAGAGNGIVRHEAYFQNRSESFIELTRTAILLHDVFRFEEVRRLFESNQPCDHGVEGAGLLASLPSFNDIRITLPIRHHGHMIEALYDDPDYQNIADPTLKSDVEHIAFAVRDADKIANWQILTHEFEAMRTVWLPHSDDRSEAQSLVDARLLNSYAQQILTADRVKNTNADVIAFTLGWVFDINYAYSITYARRLDLFNAFMRTFETLHTPREQQEQIRAAVADYVAKRFHMSAF